ncbi:conserved hypothetical protein [Candidatus Sulfotelmatomonas gaucii]|uniref:DUF1844 domain-containing protein n=1 Tax=Candidatus Sulfuritelmatomonas gaucii TaxID=2043161 RepID=A0A2N9LCJ0_9BACT|nr:conserved hypothetical protein [Candidatus Sulfotelmatomonas gaucii]
MSEKPKFEVIDRRKIKADEEKEGREAAPQPTEPAPTPGEPAPGPRLVVNEAPHDEAKEPAKPVAELAAEPKLADELPPPPTAEESHEQKAAYEASAQRLEDLIRAQNPAAGAPPQIGFEHLIQQLYLTAMLQMGAGTEEGQRPRVDIVGARATIDLLGILAEKTRGNLTSAEDRALQSALFEARMGFLELTSMMTVQPAAPPPAKK